MFAKRVLGYIFVRFFLQTHLVTLPANMCTYNRLISPSITITRLEKKFLELLVRVLRFDVDIQVEEWQNVDHQIVEFFNSVIFDDLHVVE
jgi:hypothetical protein